MKRNFSVFIFSYATLKLVCAIVLSAALILAAGCYEDKKSSSEKAGQNLLSDANAPPETESSVYQIAESNESSVSSDEQKRSNDSHSAAETASEPPSVTSENQNSETKSNYTENKSTGDDNTLNSNSAQPFEPDKPNDCDWIANRVFELLNEERKAVGVHTRKMLDGLNRIAVLRSEQLVTEFSHMYKDVNGRSWIGADFAATKFKYGEYFDWNEAGCPELADQNYYTYSGAENCCGGGGYTNEEIAQSIIASFKNSLGHWESLMSEDLYYDGVGITFGVNPQYPEIECWCSINSSAENYG